jgi:hypothetical protein
VHESLAQNKTTAIPHPTYSPGVAPCESFSFPEFQTALQVKRFNNIAMIKAKSLEALDEFPTVCFKKCFKWWCDHWLTV